MSWRWSFYGFTIHSSTPSLAQVTKLGLSKNEIKMHHLNFHPFSIHGSLDILLIYLYIVLSVSIVSPKNTKQYTLKNDTCMHTWPQKQLLLVQQHRHRQLTYFSLVTSWHAVMHRYLLQAHRHSKIKHLKNPFFFSFHRQRWERQRDPDFMENAVVHYCEWNELWWLSFVSLSEHCIAETVNLVNVVLITCVISTNNSKKLFFLLPAFFCYNGISPRTFFRNEVTV